MSNQAISISEMHNVIRTAARFKVPIQYLTDQLDCWEKHARMGIEIDDYLRWIFEFAIESAVGEYGGGYVHIEYGKNQDWHIQNNNLYLHIDQLGEESIYDLARLEAAVRRYVLSQDDEDHDRENCAEIEVMFSGLPRETKIVGRFIVSADDYERLNDRRHLYDIDIDLYDYVYRDNSEHSYGDVMRAIEEKWDTLIGGKRQW